MKLNRQVYAYWYEGEPLYLWCKKNGIRYNSVMTTFYKGFTLKEAVEHHLANRYKQTRNNLKYSIDGVPIRKILPRRLYNNFEMKIYRLNKLGIKYDWKDVYNKVKNEQQKGITE